MNDPLLVWLQERLADAEKSLQARLQMERTWKEGSDASWRAAAKMHPSTSGEPIMTKSARLKESATQGRIAMKCRVDVEMLKDAIARLTQK